MGQCGCSDTDPLFQFPGPEGVTYAIQIYQSCHYCSSPVGVDVYRFDPAEAEMWLDGVPEAPFRPYGADDTINAQLAIPVLDPEKLRQPLADAVGGDEDDADEAIECIRMGLDTAVLATVAEWRTASDGESS